VIANSVSSHEWNSTHGSGIRLVWNSTQAECPRTSGIPRAETLAASRKQSLAPIELVVVIIVP
jgi:hypothetical protein